VRVDRGVVGERVLCGKLPAGRVESGARSGDAVARVLNLLACDGAGNIGLELVAPREVLAGPGELGAPLRDVGPELGIGGEEIAHRAHGLRECASAGRARRANPPFELDHVSPVLTKSVSSACIASTVPQPGA